MQQYLPIMVAAALAAFILTPFTLTIARRIGFVDRPDTRKQHLSPIPVLGGVAIYVGFFIGVFLLGEDRPLREMLGIGGAATLVTLVGLWDDRFTINPKIKMLGQVASGALLILGGVQTRIFNNQWLDVPLTLFWVVGICNAINFMDNMDGLAAGVSAVAAGAFLWLAAINGQVLVASLAAAVLGACLGFLLYNFQPAVTFMGDTGALLLGLLLAVLGIKLQFTGRPPSVTWFLPVIVLGLPILDTSLVVISRLRRAMPVAQGSVDHVSHRLVRLGLSRRRTVVGLYAVGAALGALAVVISQAEVTAARAMAGGLILIGLLGLWALDSARLLPPPPARLGLKADFRIAVVASPAGLPLALRAALELSRDVTVLVGPRGFTLADAGEAAILLADDPSAAEALLATALASPIVPAGTPLSPARSQAMMEWLDTLNRALRLRGRLVLASDPSAAQCLWSADLLVIGPGEWEDSIASALEAPPVARTLARLKRPRVLLSNATEGWDAHAREVRISHIVGAQAPADTDGHRYLVSDLAETTQVATALAQVWLEGRRILRPGAWAANRRHG